MKIAIIGASGFVGKALISEALHRNYEVLSISRSNLKTPQDDHPKLTAKSINIYDVENLAKALEGYDVVISAFNAGWSNPNLYNDNMQGFQDIESAVKLAEVERFIMIGGAGTLSVEGQQLVDATGFPREIEPGASSCRDYFNILKKENYLNWTYFSPAPGMNPGVTQGRTGKYRLGTQNPVFDEKGRSILSVEDAAVAVIDEVENKQFIKRQFTAAY